MSTTYYICRKKEYERAEAITNFVERIRRTLHSYLDVSLPPELKDDLQLTDDLGCGTNVQHAESIYRVQPGGSPLHSHQRSDCLAP